MMLRRLLMARSASVDPTALSIYNKLAEWWSLESLVGGTLVGQHAGTVLTRLNAPVIATGKVGNGIDFESSSQQGLYLDTGSPPGNYISSSSTSACLWFKPESLSAGQSLFSIATRDNVNGQFRRLNLHIGTDGKLVAMAGNGTSLFTTTTANAASTGNWSFIQGDVVPGGSIRGRIDNGTWSSASGPASSVTTNLGIRVGLNRRSSDGYGEFFADGVADEVALFDDKLTNDEWDYIYNGGNGMDYATLKAAAGL